MTEGVQIVEGMLGGEVLHKDYRKDEGSNKQLLVPRIGLRALETHGTLQT